MQKLRFAIVGGAAHIADQHIYAIRHNPRSELIGLTDVAQERCRARAAKENAKFYPTYKELLADRDVNAVSICTPHPFHCELALAALKAGKHVLTEKPMCVTVSEADKMVRAAAKSKAKLGVVYQSRYNPNYVKAHELIASGALGPLYRTMLIYTIFRTDFYFRSGTWRATWQGEGGGILMNQASHPFDVFQWLGGAPKKVYAWTPTLKHDIEVEDCASAMLEYENGAQGFIHASTIQMPAHERMEFCGNNGRIVFDNGLTWDKLPTPLDKFQKESDLMWGQPPYETQKFPPPPETPNEAIHVPVFDDFTDKVLAGKDPLVTAAEGRKAVELANALILSHYKKKPITLPINRKEYDALLARLIRRAKKKV